jgi:predicted DNA-binding transcriptional regulator AlpA
MRILPNRPTPRDDQSLMSYFWEAAKANYHKDEVRICAWIAGSRTRYRHRNWNMNLKPGELERISSLMLLPEEKIVRMTVYAFAELLGISSFASNDIGSDANELSASHGSLFCSPGFTKYCPECLRENHYHRIHWDLHHVTVCLRHKTMLKERCPACRGCISIRDIEAGMHKCGENLASAAVESVVYADCQEYLQKRLGIWQAGAHDKESFKDVLSLEVSAVINLLEYIALAVWKLGEKFDLAFSYPDIKPIDLQSKTSKDPWRKLPVSFRNALLEDAFGILQDWPKRFNQFLELIFRELTSYGDATVPVHTKRLLKIIKDTRLGLVKAEMRKFLKRKSAAHWLEGKVLLLKAIDLDVDELKSVSINKVTSALHMKQSLVLQLLKKESIKIMPDPTSGAGIQLIKRQDSVRFVTAYDNRFRMQQIAKQLNIDRSDAFDLIKSNTLAHVRESHQCFFVAHSVLAAFEQKYIKDIAVLDKSSPMDVIDIRRTAELLGILRWQFPKVLHLIDGGILRPMRLKGSEGLASIVFDASEVRRLSSFCDGATHWLRLQEASGHKKKSSRLLTGKEHELDSYRYLNEAVHLIQCSCAMVEKLGKAGFLEIIRTKRSDGKGERKVPLDSFLRFRAKYVSRDETEKIIGVKKWRLAKYQSSGIIKRIPVNGENGRCRVYLREEAERLSMNNFVSSAEAAAILCVSRGVLYRLINTNRLTPDSSHGNRVSFWFLREDVDRLKMEMADQLTVKELMKASGLTKIAIWRMITKGILKPVSGGRPVKEYYRFSQDEVKELVREYGSSDAAVFLGISASTVRNLARNGILKATDGPTVDQSRHYRFRFRELSEFKYSYGDDLGIIVKQRNLQLVDVKVLATELGISVSYAKALIFEGFITPFIRVRCKENVKKPLFRRCDIRRIKEKRANGLLSATDAAKVLGQDLKMFKNKWLDTGILKPVRKNIGIEKMHFRKEDVRRAKLFQKSTVTGPTAAKMLGVHRTKVMKWTKSGELRAVSGPSVDGFGCYLYKRKDVNKLLKERKEGVKMHCSRRALRPQRTF